MTIPNYITIGRMLLIPVFATLFLYYRESVRSGAPDEALRWWAAGAFLAAALCDGIDGFLARRLGQHTRLGAVLDPIADKSLTATALLLLSFAGDDTAWRLPIWFAVLVIGRDILLVTGCAVLHHVAGKVEIRPSRTGKAATALQMASIAMALARPPGVEDAFGPLVVAAGALTAVSFVSYLVDGVRALGRSS